jgi:hypothetical protein
MMGVIGIKKLFNPSKIPMSSNYVNMISGFMPLD